MLNISIRMGKYYLIEIGARGGGNLISAVIVPLMSGVDNYAYLVDSCFGFQARSCISSAKIVVIVVACSISSILRGQEARWLRLKEKISSMRMLISLIMLLISRLVIRFKRQ